MDAFENYFISAYNRAPALSVYGAYKHPSDAKVRAERAILREMSQRNGWGYKSSIITVSILRLVICLQTLKLAQLRCVFTQRRTSMKWNTTLQRWCEYDVFAWRQGFNFKPNCHRCNRRLL